jgi:hypothetical protein
LASFRAKTIQVLKESVDSHFENEKRTKAGRQNETQNVKAFYFLFFYELSQPTIGRSARESETTNREEYVGNIAAKTQSIAQKYDDINVKILAECGAPNARAKGSLVKNTNIY